MSYEADYDDLLRYGAARRFPKGYDPAPDLEGYDVLSGADRKVARTGDTLSDYYAALAAALRSGSPVKSRAGVYPLLRRTHTVRRVNRVTTYQAYAGILESLRELAEAERRVLVQVEQFRNGGDPGGSRDGVNLNPG